MTKSAVEALGAVLFANVEQLLLEGDDLDQIHSAIDRHALFCCARQLDQLTRSKISLMEESYKRASEYEKHASDDEYEPVFELDDDIQYLMTDNEVVEMRAARMARAIMFALDGNVEIKGNEAREAAIDRVFRHCIASGASETDEDEEPSSRYPKVLRYLISKGVVAEPPPPRVAAPDPQGMDAGEARDDDDDIPF